jgi:PadR family transcriptional regulator PadR
VAQSEFLRNWESQARKGSLELVVMSALARSEFYGYQLVEHLRDVLGLDVKDGTLYAILIRLEREGLVRHRWEHLSSGPARKYYALTKSGAASLSAMRKLWLEIAAAVGASRG